MELQKLIDDAKATGMLIGRMETPLIVGYEVGEIQKLVVYAHVAEDEAYLYLPLLAPAIADTLIQLRVLCHLYGFDFAEMDAMGRERFEQRIFDRQREQGK